MQSSVMKALIDAGLRPIGWCVREQPAEKKEE
jgi:hypothetical protein